ncbi:ELM1/GtrOC1 family putative glycosyltransferase [Alphaproteobacteria bacterium]|nr:ELM1/GtrOC1 family putative glycosyltransferase [Alphaproteobacteria bacterium]
MNLDKLKIWSVTDGSQGMKSQANGLSENISSNIKEIEIDLIFPWNNIQPGFLPTYKWIFKNKIPLNEEPNILISCGRKSVYFSLYCKKKYKNLINIHIQNPKISSKKFSYVICPNHDNFFGSNVINSVGALHHFNKPKETPNPKLLTCMVGGNNQHYHFNANEAFKLCEKIKEIKKNKSDLEISIITSRRTSDEIKNILISTLGKDAKIWIGKGNNPYERAIQESSYFIVTSDSTSMISETAISEKPIYVYHLPFKRKSMRITNFHNEFNKLEITQDINLVQHLKKWEYNSLNESKRIARVIKKRIIEDNNES